ncbi:pectate lyase family protein [Cellvibrio sp. ARAG 10.3]|uniref:pectate lyase family protein n=1 Tax=Cellvibrio sp. ARAG 10.3 TaxID=3451358 RepID=UPI003F47178E
MKITQLALTIALTSALVACGGGSSGSGSSAPVSSSSASSSLASSSVQSSAGDSSSANSSSESSAISSSNSSNVESSSSSSASGTDGIRPAKIEGFAAYENVTGGQGGPVYLVSTGTELNQALCGSRNGNRTAPVVILVNGTINHANTTAQGCDTQSDVIEIKNTSNVSIIGVGTNALFDEIGIHLRSANNIIIQNVHIRNVKKSGTPTSNGGDAIGIERDVNRVWIDHNWLEASGGEKDGYDSLLDMKDGVTNVTVSYNLFNDSSRGGLIGSNDSPQGNDNITFHHNWYKNIEQRTPLIRHALVHIYNNYWSNENRAAMIHGINSRSEGRALVESNYFHNTNNPLLASSDSPTPGCWQTNNDNTLVDSIYSRSVGNGALIIPEIIDGQMQSISCNAGVPYTVEMDAAADVPAIVMANAGVGKIDVSIEGAIAVPGTGSSSSAGNSSSSSSSGVIEMTDLPVSEGFNNVVSATDFFSATYKALASSFEPFYYRSGGTVTFSGNQVTLAGGRFTLANTQPATSTTSGDTQTFGELDLSQAYRISFCVKAASGAGALQVSVNNNGTSAGNSIHGSSSRVFNAGADTLTAGQRVVIDSSVGNANSFIQLRTESSATVVIDDLWIGYQSDTDSEPDTASCTTD